MLSTLRTVLVSVKLVLFLPVLKAIIIPGSTFGTLKSNEYLVSLCFSCHHVTSSLNKINGGKGWVRTTVGVPPADLQSAPFDHSGTLPPILVWSQRRDSNPQPADYKSAALPVELRWPDSR